MIDCLPHEVHRRCMCGLRNTVTIFPPKAGDLTVDKFSCLCGSRFKVSAIWVSGTGPVTKTEDR